MDNPVPDSVTPERPDGAEQKRLEEAREHTTEWKRWGPYLSERAWGTVREDYSPDGTAWDYFPHDHARSRTYRWSEDGIAGISDKFQLICFALTLWNGKDPILKERLFGLTGPEGNHGEDVKEYYYYLDSTPTHSYMKFLYKYPQAEYPYRWLVEENHRRGKQDPEFELLDTGVFDGDHYYDVFVEYAKASEEDILVRISAVNRGPEVADLHLLPTLWYRNNWSWGYPKPRPELGRAEQKGPAQAVRIDHELFGTRWLYVDGAPELLFTGNETNNQRLFNAPNTTPYVKDAFNTHLVEGRQDAVNPEAQGTKAAAHYKLSIGPGETAVIQLRLSPKELPERRTGHCGDDFDSVFEDRVREADEFYATVIPSSLSEDAQMVMRQALAGLLLSKQFYHYNIEQWLQGDPAMPPPPPQRLHGRNSDWQHMVCSDVISMPDKWEYPWFAKWDLAFHCIALAIVDSDFAKDQILLMCCDRYLHPNGQHPAYEWAFGDVNPPVLAWAAMRVYEIERKRSGDGDRKFLERVFFKLMLNFTWWVNRKDAEGNNIFEGGFLGMDNIGVFDRSAALPTGGFIEQSDGTSWMAMYTLDLLAIALELAREDSEYEDMATKFWEHFLYIAHAMDNRGDSGVELWDDEDGFFYDVLHLPDGQRLPLKIRSMVGLIPLLAVETMEEGTVENLPGFAERMEWFLRHRPDLTQHTASVEEPGEKCRRLLSIVNADELRKVLKVMLDEEEFLSPYGIRAVSRYHKDHPFCLQIDGATYKVDYEPAESTTGLFGGNSNWRGPVWMPVNYLIIDSLQIFHYYYGDEYKVECPTGSGNMMTLWEVAVELSHRISLLFLRNAEGKRPVFGGSEKFQTDPHWRDHLLFYEYFHGDNGAGLGASHQTGWTAVVAKLLQQSGESASSRGLTENDYQDEDLAGFRNLAAALFRLENSRPPETVQAVVESLVRWLDEAPNQELSRAFATYIQEVIPTRGWGAPISAVRELQEVNSMLAERAKQRPVEWEQKGKRGVLLLLLEQKFGPVDEAVRQRVTEANSATLTEWVARVLQADRIEDVVH